MIYLYLKYRKTFPSARLRALIFPHSPRFFVYATRLGMTIQLMFLLTRFVWDPRKFGSLANIGTNKRHSPFRTLRILTE